jgi:AcrR family transcriptional regulator
VSTYAPLPRGRHALSREDVARSQRERMLWGLAETMAEKGYVATSIADILKAAGVSRQTFYEQFSSKEDCFMAAFDGAMQLILAPAIAEARGGEGEPLDRFSSGLRLYLNGLAANPALARVFLIEVYAAGPEIGRRRARAFGAYADLVNGTLGFTRKADLFAGRSLAAAISMMVTVALLDDDAASLPELHGPLCELAARLTDSSRPGRFAR